MSRLLDKNSTQMMKLSYILQNKDGRGRRVPTGQSWQWVHAVQDLEQLTPILEWLTKRVQMDQLELMNVYIDHVEITSPQFAWLGFETPSHIRYSKITAPHRVIDMRELVAAPTQPSLQVLRLVDRPSVHSARSAS
jgi:hypothetical protein